MGELPQELFVEILLHLPVNSLLRFRSLSKSLCEHIDSPDFINSHLVKSSQNMNLRKLIFSDHLLPKFDVYDANVDLDGESILLGKPVSSSWKPPLVGYCKGLLLLYQRYPYGFSVWNPSTRQRRDLPDCPIEIQPNIRSYKLNGSGLGYDHSIDEYKAVFIMLVEGKFSRRRQLDQVWIYGLKSNIWRSQNLPYVNCSINNASFTNSQGCGFSIDGSLNWLCEHSLNNKWQLDIMSFDVKKETFSLVSQPICSTMKNSLDGRSLHVLEDCLCISYFYRNIIHCKAELYMRKKDNEVSDEFTWIQLYSIVKPIYPKMLQIGVMEVLEYSKSGDKILLHLNTYGMFWYNLKNKSLGKVEGFGADSSCFANCPIICIESLVSLGGTRAYNT